MAPSVAPSGTKETPTGACTRGCLGLGRMDLERRLERAGVVLGLERMRQHAGAWVMEWPSAGVTERRCDRAHEMCIDRHIDLRQIGLCRPLADGAVC